MSERKDITRTASDADIDRFLNRVAATPRAATDRGRLLFAMDATQSREHSWDQAAQIQAEMFGEAAHLGGLELQLCYFRGFMEFDHSPWLRDSGALSRYMSAVSCAAGHTQLQRCLEHAATEAGRRPLDAVVYVGDCLEETPDLVAGAAGRLALLGIPLFVFQEGYDAIAEPVFRHIAELTRGAWCRFDGSSPRQLRELLSAVAVYAAGGRQALEHYGHQHGGLSRHLTRLLK